MDEPRRRALRLTYRDAFVTVLCFYTFLHIIVIAQTSMWAWAPNDFVMQWMIGFCEQFQEHGIFNVWTPYPQGTNIIYYSIYSLASLGPWRDFLFWVYYKLLMHVIPNILTLYLIHRMGRSLGDDRLAFLASMFYVFSFATYFYGLLTNFVYDPLPVLITTLGLYLLINRRSKLSALVLGLGAGVKLFPLLLFPIGLKFLRGRERVNFAVIFPLTVCAIFLPFASANLPAFLSTYYWQNGRPPWETLFSYVLAATDAPFEYDQPYYRDYFSDHAGWLFWGITPDPAVLVNQVPPQPLRWWNVVSLIGFIAMFALFIPSVVEGETDVIRWGSYLFISFFLWNIGWSPQYELFIIPLLLYTFRRVEKSAVAICVLQACVALEYALSPPEVVEALGIAAKISFGLIRYGLFVYTIAWMVLTRAVRFSFVDRQILIRLKSKVF